MLTFWPFFVIHICYNLFCHIRINGTNQLDLTISSVSSTKVEFLRDLKAYQTVGSLQRHEAPLAPSLSLWGISWGAVLCAPCHAQSGSRGSQFAMVSSQPTLLKPNQQRLVWSKCAWTHLKSLPTWKAVKMKQFKQIWVLTELVICEPKQALEKGSWAKREHRV